LWRDGRPVPLTSKTFELLVVLLERRDRVVSKDELLGLVWPDTAVNENNLARQISSLRRALGQRPDQHDFIVTVPGQGYRFVAMVEDLPASDPGMTAEDLARSAAVAPPDRGDVSANGEPRHQADVAGITNQTDAVASNWLVGWPSGGLSRTIWAAVALAIGATVLWTLRADQEPRRSLQRITYEAATLPREASWAPDGQWLVYASDRGGKADLWKQQIGDPDPVRLTSSEFNASQPQWSPDGRAIVFRSERDGGGLYLIPADGGVERIVSNFGYEPRWSPDATSILFKRSLVLPGLPAIYTVGLDGRPPRPFRPDVLGEFQSVQVAWHPDGRRISVWGTTHRGTMRFLTVPVDGGAPTSPRIPGPVQRDLAGISPQGFVWATSRRFIYVEGRAGDTHNIWRISVDPVTENWIDGPQRLTTGAGDETNVVVSPDGSRLLFTTTTSTTRLWAFPLDAATGRITGRPYAITQGSTGEVDFDARADGSKVAYGAVRAGRNELWERSIAEGRERLLLASTDWRFTKPRWSPDGARLAFSRSARRGAAEAVAVLNADGSGERVLTAPGRVEMQASDWSNDGQTILGACRFSASDRYATCVVPLSAAGDGGVRVLASDPKRNLFNQRFSPNQRWIAFLAHDLTYASTSTVYVIPVAGGRWTAVTDGAWFDDKPRWGPDGRTLYFVSNRNGVANVWGRRFDEATGMPVGDPFPVTSFRSAQFELTPRTVQMDIAVTGTQLLLPMSEARSEIWMLDQADR
jgi:Tol biopolymer transport system component/DNA-binding winged helix-turn-helix (wHTH) protein